MSMIVYAARIKELAHTVRDDVLVSMEFVKAVERNVKIALEKAALAQEKGAFRSIPLAPPVDVETEVLFVYKDRVRTTLEKLRKAKSVQIEEAFWQGINAYIAGIVTHSVQAVDPKNRLLKQITFTQPVTSGTTTGRIVSKGPLTPANVDKAKAATQEKQLPPKEQKEKEARIDSITPVQPRNHTLVAYSATVQDKTIVGTWCALTGKTDSEIVSALTNYVRRHLGFLGIDGADTVEIKVTNIERKKH